MSNANEVIPVQAERLEAAGHWLLRLREDSLSEREMSEWIEWCESNPDNLAAFEELHALWRAAGEHPPVAPKKAGVRNERRLQLPVYRFALAASVAIILMSAALLLFNRQPSTSIQTIAAIDRVATPVAQNREALLPDGSHVAIGARSLLEVDFTPTRRQLQLREGQAFFRVERDKTRPFIVDAGSLQIAAIGTAFDVRHGAHTVIVTVQEGVVEISRSSASRADTSRLTAGQQFTFDSVTGQVRQTSTDPEVALAWRAGRLEFTGDSLETVIASVNRYSQRPIVLSDPALGKLNFTGTIFTDSIDVSLDALEQVFPISIQRDDKQTILAPAGP